MTRATSHYNKNLFYIHIDNSFRANKRDHEFIVRSNAWGNQIHNGNG